jgi:hypothetical protein
LRARLAVGWLQVHEINDTDDFSLFLFKNVFSTTKVL